MADRIKSKFCKVCNAQVAVRKAGPNHVLHLLLSVVTAGLWVPVWFLCCLDLGGGYRCTRCGSGVKVGVLG